MNGKCTDKSVATPKFQSVNACLGLFFLLS